MRVEDEEERGGDKRNGEVEGGGEGVAGCEREGGWKEQRKE